MKKGALIISLILSVILFASLVSAQWYGDLRGAAEQVISWIQEIFGPFFEILLGASQFDEYFFVRVMLLILLYVVVLSILKRIEIFSNKPFVYILISAIVSILSTRYLTEIELIEAILLPYGVLGIALAVFLPFLIYFFFVHQSITGGTGRRLAWTAFAAVFFGLWISRYKDMGNYNWIYWIGIAIVALSFIFDKAIHRYFALHEIGKWKRNVSEAEIARLQKTYQDIAEVNTPEARRVRERIIKRLKELGGEIP